MDGHPALPHATCGAARSAAAQRARRVRSRLTPPSTRAGTHAIAALTATAASAACQGIPSAIKAATRAPSRGLAPFGPGTAPASWLAPNAPSTARGGQIVTGGVDGAHQERRDGELVAGRQDERDSELSRRRQRPAGEQVGPDLSHDERGGQGEHRDTARDQRHPQWQRRAGEDHERREAERADEPVAADAQDRVTSTEAGAGQPVHAPDVGADVPGGEQPEQLALGVGTDVPPARTSGRREGSPAEGAQEVLADQPRHHPQGHRPRAEVREPLQGDHRDDRADGHAEDDERPRPGDGAQVVHTWPHGSVDLTCLGCLRVNQSMRPSGRERPTWSGREVGSVGAGSA